MKSSQIAIILIILFLIIILSIYAIKIDTKIKLKNLQRYNLQYETYLNKTITGTELATVINKAINLNENNNINKDEKNYYIEDDEQSLKIEIKMVLTDKTYPMEEIYNNNTEEFVKYFNLEKFNCISIEHHKKTGKISKMLFEQVENKNTSY